MEFDNGAQKTTYERVRQFLAELYGDAVVVGDEGPYFLLPGDSAFVTVAVEAWADDAGVQVMSFLVTEIDPSDYLEEFLLRANYDLAVAGFGVDGEGDVFYKQTLVGSTLDKHELDVAVNLVLGIADAYDDEIISRFGGLDARTRIARASS